jgi:hypothetical protein
LRVYPVFRLALIDFHQQLADEPCPIKAQSNLRIPEHLRHETQAEPLLSRLSYLRPAAFAPLQG